MLYANVDVNLHRLQSKQRYVELPLESFDRSQDNDKVYLNWNLLIV